MHLRNVFFWNKLQLLNSLFWVSREQVLYSILTRQQNRAESFSSTYFNKGRLTWNSNASPEYDFLHASTKYTKSTPHLKREIYM